MNEMNVNPPVGADKLMIVGEVLEVTGATARLSLDSPYARICGQVGTLLMVETGTNTVLCLISGIKAAAGAREAEETYRQMLEVELVGELTRGADGEFIRFRKGVSIYPKIGDPVVPANRNALKAVYHLNDPNAVEIGHIHQDPTIPATARIEHLLSKHFAIVGSTGTGKSCSTALILRQIVDRCPNAHIVLLDPHGEYGTCFGDGSEVISLDQLNLPFWFLNFEEAAEIMVGHTDRYGEELELLRDLIPQAKLRYATENREAGAARLQRTTARSHRYSVDVPVPYRISDLLALLDEQMGKLEMKSELRTFKRLKMRLESVSRDPRFAFMFGGSSGEDSLAAELRRLFRVPADGRPISVIQLAGLPTEVVNVVVSVLARLAFDLAVFCGGNTPITFVCEEAHRYVPNNDASGFEPTRRAISRIAREGRKYGVSLGIVSQRPGDIDPTILSQCSTLFTMRLSNERDQQIIRSALSDTSESLLQFIPALGDGEAILFGEAVSLPSRVILSKLLSSALPSHGGAEFVTAWCDARHEGTEVEDVVDRWREATHATPDAREAGSARRATDAPEAVAAQVAAAAPAQPQAQGHSAAPAAPTVAPPPRAAAAPPESSPKPRAGLSDQSTPSSIRALAARLKTLNA